MTRPVRLQLSRREGFDLQRLSLETNGLPAVSVARPSKWGNPFKWTDGVEVGGALWAKGASADMFREWLNYPARFPLVRNPPTSAEIRDALQGRNLACFCHPGEPCHADVLLQLANPGSAP